jgi:hypothetical protein
VQSGKDNREIVTVRQELLNKPSPCVAKAAPACDELATKRP